MADLDDSVPDLSFSEDNKGKRRSSLHNLKTITWLRKRK